jgi:hypothetical protein
MKDKLKTIDNPKEFTFDEFKSIIDEGVEEIGAKDMSISPEEQEELAEYFKPKENEKS